MKKIDRIREKVSILPTSLYLSKMHDAGWSLVALEWEREVEVSGDELPEPAAEHGSEEISNIVHNIGAAARVALAGQPFSETDFRKTRPVDARKFDLKADA